MQLHRFKSLPISTKSTTKWRTWSTSWRRARCTNSKNSGKPLLPPPHPSLFWRSLIILNLRYLKPSRINLTFYGGCIENCRIALTNLRLEKSLSSTTSTISDSSYRRSMLTERTKYPTSRTRTQRKSSRSISFLKLLRSPAPMPLILRMCILIGATASIQAPTRTRTPCLMIRTTMIVM